MEKSFDVEGKTHEEALAKGLRHLGLNESDVDVKVVDSKRKFLGVIGRSRVCLRLHYDSSPDHQHVARGVLGQLLDKMGFSASIDVNLEGEDIHLDLRGKNIGSLIGRRGETLDALEYLVSRIANRPPKERTRVYLDADGYRERSANQLRSLARRFAEKVKQQGKPFSCRPMNARDRRIIHIALRDEEGVETLSEGEGLLRCVTISPLP